MKIFNTRYRNKPQTTDVLSFPMSKPLNAVPQGREILLGDVVINAHMAKRRAEEEGMPLNAVIRQLLIHGILHLMGYDHEKSRSAHQKMTKKESQLSDALAQMD
jgi:probable rRNA maturation factor